jgi:hypothetical protein
MDSSAAIKGSCKAELDGGDAGCSGVGVYWHFKNGHDLINFPGTDVDALAFAGPSIDSKNNTNNVLSVDHVYINENIVDADGQCSFEIEESASPKTTIQCRAKTRDGRNLTVALDSDKSWGTFVGKLQIPGQRSAPQPFSGPALAQTLPEHFTGKINLTCVPDKLDY